MRAGLGVCAAAAVAFGAGNAGAVDFLVDNFDGEVPVGAGAPAYELNYNHFANFFVYDGTVDLVSAAQFGIDTGNGYFVDLDGSTGDGATIESISQFDFDAGDRIRLTFEASGNQRSAQSGVNDSLFGGFKFYGAMPTFTNVQVSGFGGIQNPAPNLIGVQTLVPWDQPWSTYAISFTATSAGRLSIILGTGSAGDNEGPLIDNIRVGTVVPEPGTWALIVLGFGGAGAALRRRRGLVAAPV